MGTKFVIILLLISLLPAISQYNSITLSELQVNLVTDGDLELWDDDSTLSTWLQTDISLNKETGVVHNGTTSASINQVGFDTHFYQQITDFKGLPNNVDYTFIMWVYDNNPNVSVKVRLPFGPYQPDITYADEAAWQKIQVHIPAEGTPFSGGYLFIDFYGAGPATDLYVDTIILSPSSMITEETGSININPDNSFSSYGIPGDGSDANPYRIENTNFSTGSSIRIAYVTGNVIIHNIHLNSPSGSFGIEIQDLNGKIWITNSTITNAQKGIIIDNQIGMNYYGPHVIANNSLSDIQEDAIRVGNVRATISSNQISHASYGIHAINKAYNVQVEKNIISNCTEGIFFFDIDGVIMHNLLRGNNNGINIQATANVEVGFNQIQNSTSIGISIQNWSYNHLIHHNLINTSGFYAMYFFYSSSGSSIYNNTILNTLEPFSQIYDQNADNSFWFNYFSDHQSPDDNLDGIVDIPYAIDSDTGTVQDANPVCDIKVTVNQQIEITSNEDLLQKQAIYGWRGTGTNEDPIRISGHYIHTNHSIQISVSSVSYYIIIENNTILGTGGGIFLSSVSHAEIRNNQILIDEYRNDVGNYYGVSIFSCFGIVVSNNSIENTQVGSYGLSILFSQGIVVDNNEIKGYRMGLYEEGGRDIIIRDNIIVGGRASYSYGLDVRGGQIEITNNHISSQMYIAAILNGQYINMSQNIILSGTRSNSDPYSHGLAVHGSYNVVSNNSITGSGHWAMGLTLYSHHSIIYGNSIQAGGGNIGLHIANSYYNNVSWNSIKGRDYAIYREDFDGETSSGNQLVDNYLEGEIFNFPYMAKLANQHNQGQTISIRLYNSNDNITVFIDGVSVTPVIEDDKLILIFDTPGEYQVTISVNDADNNGFTRSYSLVIRAYTAPSTTTTFSSQSTTLNVETEDKDNSSTSGPPNPLPYSPLYIYVILAVPALLRRKLLAE
ncbi:MAG: right-handed parallel beta-helix repeat-containing protein [Candidatus Heimdallarchaeota archaeon]|nr:right-handed parallel beta-helix repeat-containing protein [Candidatus Heimdallarchaeota archaeon]